MILIPAFLRILIAFLTLAPVKTSDIQIDTPRGTKLEARLSRPVDATVPLPAVVLAPGVGYDMDRPRMRRTAERLADRGFLALRFYWGFYTHKTPRGPGLRSEIEDLRAALATIRRNKAVDRKRVFVLGKSLGSLVGLETATTDQDLAGLVLLTFAMHDQARPERVRPIAAKLPDLDLPVLIVGGDNDPLCNTAALDKLAAKCRHKPEVHIVPGDHTLQAGSREATEQSIERAVNKMVEWLRRRADDET
jgi:predicted alpha/beta-hydrolase family hydrolase